MASRSVGRERAHIADALTGGRFVLAVLAIPAVATGSWLIAAIIVTTAWWSDYLDGRLARATTGTRMGPWDPRADTAVGVAIVTGMVLGDHLPPVPWLVAAGGFAAVYLWTGNFAFGQLTQAVGYGTLLWFEAVEEPAGFSLLATTIVVIAALDWRVLVDTTLPTFFDGLGLRRRRIG